jgi:hypothetical protein
MAPRKSTTAGKGSKKAAKKSSVSGRTKKASASPATSKKAAKKASKRSRQDISAAKVPVIKANQVQIRYLQEAYKFSEARRRDEIHPRKNIPKVKRGPQVMDMLPTSPLSFEDTVSLASLAEIKRSPLTPTDTITLVKNVQLNDVATADTASHVCEPSAAINGNVVFYTGNWFAAVSVDGGTTFKFVDPYTTFPDPPGMGFCCDQVVHYVKSIDTFLWLLQYTQDPSGKNIQRIAFATTAKVKTGTWKFFDITPASLGQGTGVWLDFPDLSISQNMVYMTTNCFKGNNWKASVVTRIKLTSFTTGVLAATKASSTVSFSLRVAQHCGTTAYFVSHNSTSSIRVYSWKETANAPTSKDIAVASWSAGPYSSIVPDGHNWLQRADSRHTGATLAANELWFAWGSAKGGANNRPNAFTQIARINITNMTLIENINLWDPNSAIAYAGLSTNVNNEVGVSYTIGGGTKFPTHVVGILTGTRRQVTTFVSTRGPSDNKWGDYLTVRRNYPNQKLFCATGYALLSGAGNSDATPSLTIFGRSGEV